MTKPAPLRLVVADASLLAREALTAMLHSIPDFEVVEVCGDLDSLLAAVDAQHPDVVMTEVSMPPTHTDEGIRAAAEFRTTHPEVAVIVVSQSIEVDYVLEFLRHGSDRRAYLI